MGGRAAEELKFKEFTTGASNDLQRATEIAHRMVCEFGMSERLGPRAFGEPTGQIFLGKDIARDRNFSEETATLIDNEIHDLLENAYARALDILNNNQDILDRIGQALLERESIDAEELDMLIRGETLKPLYKDPNLSRETPGGKAGATGSTEEKDHGVVSPVLQPPTVLPS
jgi:cell division protease FtsH